MATREVSTTVKSRPEQLQRPGYAKLHTPSGYRHHSVLHVGISDLLE